MTVCMLAPQASDWLASHWAGFKGQAKLSPAQHTGVETGSSLASFSPSSLLAYVHVLVRLPLPSVWSRARAGLHHLSSRAPVLTPA
jgi:hypothetical protein